MRISIGLAFAVVITGCGGGGAGKADTVPPSTVTPPASNIDGLYLGAFSDGRVHETVILENGQIYLIYGNRTNNVLQEQGLIEGPGSLKSGSFVSAETRDFANSVVIRNLPAFQDVVTDKVFSASISASSNTNGGLNGNISETGTTIQGEVLGQPSTVTFSGVRPNRSIYDYDKPASLSDVVGSWGRLEILDITADGKINFSSRQCAAQGTIKPRPTGKNIFDIEWSFVAIPACPFYGQTIKSIGFLRSLEPSSLPVGGQLIIVNTDIARTTKRNYIFYR